MPLLGTRGAASARGFGLFGRIPGDPFFSSTTLLLPGNGTNGAQNNTFLDSSTNNFTITRNGNTTQGTFSPFPPASGTAYSAAANGGSGYFDGSGDYLSGIGLVSSFNFMHNTSALFTAECWVYLPSTANEQYFFANNGTTSSQIGCSFFVQAGGNLGLLIARGVTGISNVTINASGSSAVPTNQWVHVAVTYDQSLASNNAKFYINSVAAGTGTKTGLTPSSADASNTLVVGAGTSAGVGPINGYISSLRITNSIVYAAAFTPPTAPLTAIANTSLLLNFTNAGVLDATAKNDLETVGNAQISTAQSKWGGASIAFDGTGDYLPVPRNSGFAFGTGDFTVEYWAYSQDVSTPAERGTLQTSDTVGGLKTTYTTGIMVAQGVGGNGKILANVAGTSISSATAPLVVNTWQHIAIVRNSGTVTIYVNGTSVASGTASGNCSGEYLAVGGYYSTAYLFNGYIDDLRITKGVARYTANFTAPTAAFPLY